MATTAELLKAKAAQNKAASPTDAPKAKTTRTPAGAAEGGEKAKREYKPRRPAGEVLASLEERRETLISDFNAAIKRIDDHIEKLKNGPRPVVTRDDLAAVAKSGKSKAEILADIKAAQAKMRAQEKLLASMSDEEVEALGESDEQAEEEGDGVEPELTEVEGEDGVENEVE